MTVKFPQPGELEAIRIALTGQKPPAEYHADIKTAVAAAAERIATMPTATDANQ